MAKLYFYYGAMNSSKTANALMTHFNYQEVGQRALLCKTETDTRDGERVIRSRIGLEMECIFLRELVQMPEEEIKSYDCIIVDEVQFATREQIDFLSDIVDFMEVPVVCSGLRRLRQCAGVAERRHVMRVLTAGALCAMGNRSYLAPMTTMWRSAAGISSLGCCARQGIEETAKQFNPIFSCS